MLDDLICDFFFRFLGFLQLLDLETVPEGKHSWYNQSRRQDMWPGRAGCYEDEEYDSHDQENKALGY